MNKLPSVVIVGSGNVATQLGKELHRLQFPILQVVSRDETRARLLADELQTDHSSTIHSIKKEADWYILAVKDDAIEEVANQFNVGDKIVCHTSGSADIEVLKNASSNYGVFYPLQTFSKDRQTHWGEIPICLEGNNDHTMGFLANTASMISLNVLKLNTEKRRWVHLAAVWGNNFTNYMLSEAETICKKHGISFSILKPLLEETITKAFEKGPSQSQTGPAIRHDEHTIQNHLKMMEGDEKMRELYLQLSNAIGGFQNH